MSDRDFVHFVLFLVNLGLTDPISRLPNVSAQFFLSQKSFQVVCLLYRISKYIFVCALSVTLAVSFYFHPR
ncbi:hypothetical protein QTP88_009193 [Uroleucon formosanum]